MGCCSEAEILNVTRMMREHNGKCMVKIVCGDGEGRSPEDELRHLEEYQRDLEQEVADVAERIKTLKTQGEAAEA